MNFVAIKNYISLLFAISLVTTSLNGQNGAISGKIFDESTGETLIFANVTLKNINSDESVAYDYGITTDMDGNYQFNKLETGTYTLKASYISFADKVISDIVVNENELVRLDISMSEGSQELEEVVITAEAVRRTEVALMVLQKKAAKIQDGISRQEIGRFGSSNAAESMKRVVGASVLGGKYVYLRGIGDRYNSTQLNGQVLPSTDPYRNATQLDLIPSTMLENLIAYKTFTPDQPGNSTGGSLNISTKSFPEQFIFNVNLTTSYNTVSSFTDNFLTYEGGANDGLGFDDGTRDLPSQFSPEILELSTNKAGTIRNTIRADETGLGDRFHSAMESVSNQMSPTKMSIPMNYRASMSIGNKFDLGGKPLGVLLSLSYDRSYNHYEGGDLSFWELTQSGGLQSFYELKENRSEDNPVIGGLLNLSYKFSPGHKISFNTLYNHNAVKTGIDILGDFDGKISGNAIYHSRLLYWNERDLMSFQLKGDHAFGSVGDVKIDWYAGRVESSQIEPDSRVFDNTITFRENLGQNGELVIDTFYGLDESEFQLPFHFWRDLTDIQYNAAMNLTVPILQNVGTTNMLQFGVSYITKDREFNDMELQYQNVKTSNINRYDGNDDAFFSNENVGIIDYASNGRPNLGLYLENQFISTRKNSYTGNETVTAGYGMFTLDFAPLKLIGGARIEQTDISVASRDTTLESGDIQATDVLPSLNVIYALNDDMNLRAAVSRTLARPNMRELSPFSSFDRGTDIRLFGNPDLKRTLITNYDLRWEWYPTAGEMMAVSGFYKLFNDPIIKTFNPLQPNKQIKFDNVGDAKVYGVELEIRKRLDFLGTALQNFRLLGNVAFTKSVVDIPGSPEEENTEQWLIAQFNPGKGFTRPFQGQSPFLANISLNYVNTESQIDAILSYNVFGKRLTLNNGGASPDFYEQPIPQLDFSFQKTFNNLGLKFAVRNILNANYLQTLTFGDDVRNIEARDRGITFSLGFSYTVR